VARDIEEMDLIEVEIPSHRQALEKAWREGCIEMASAHRQRNVPILQRLHHKGRLALVLGASAIIGVSVVVVCLVLSFSGGTGEATTRMEEDKLREEVIVNIKELMPEADTSEESLEFSRDLDAAFWVKDAEGQDLGMIFADRSTGDIIFLFDARPNSAGRISADVNISLDRATAIAEGFFKSHAIDLEHYALEKDPLVLMGMEGPPDNPKPVYGYEFNYRIQVNGIFVDDFENGQGSCLMEISPEDGSIKTFLLPRNLVSLPNLPCDEIKIGKEEVLGIAAEKVKGVELDEGKTPVVQSDDVELRYMVIKNRLVPYWLIDIRYRDANLGDLSLMPEEATYMGGCSYYISATDGEILMEGDICIFSRKPPVF